MAWKLVSIPVLAIAPSISLAAAGQNQPPLAPTITEPTQPGPQLNPADVHMETAPFADPDAGDQHEASDWEIWRLNPLERVWAAEGVTGPEKVHCHLGDGDFENSHAGRSELFPATSYRMKVRHADDSGDPTTRWSAYSQIDFVTGDLHTTYPLELQDVLDPPPSRWVLASNDTPVVLPGGSPAPKLRVESAHGDLLLEYAGTDGSANAITNPAALPHHDPVRVRVIAGNGPLAIGPSNLELYDDGCHEHTLLLPAIQLAAGQTAHYWIAITGASYGGAPTQTTPTFFDPLRRLSPPWHARQPGFRVETFAEGFRLPVDIAFVPSPGPDPGDVFFYVTELYGSIKVVRRNGVASDYATNLLNFDPSGNFPGSGELGVAGIAVEATTGDLFVSMVYQLGNQLFPKLVRFASQDGGYTAATQTIVLNLLGEPMSQSHQISNVSFGPDGKLYVHVGDGYQASTAQDLDSFRGKILRLELDGSACTDNPFFDATDGIDAEDYVYAYGFRNPFGGGWREEDGRLYEVENGPGRDRFAQVVPGRNYLWDGTNSSMLSYAIYTWFPAHAPVNVLFVQPGTFGGSGFPARSMGHAFVTESGPTHASGPQSNGKRITEWILDGAGNLVTGPVPFLEYAGHGKATSCGLAAGPDGLYMTELYPDENTSPIALGAKIARIWYDSSFDCNGNEVDDACDIAIGTSTDANANGLPDECECVGTNFCQSTPNSAGGPALISSNGACVVAENALVLSAQPVPNQPGIFYYGMGQTNGGAGVPFLDGFRCVGGGSTTFRLPALTASGNVATLSVDLTDPSSPAGQITAGSTWHFQYWFRDPAAGGTGANLSDGLTIDFE